MYSLSQRSLNILSTCHEDLQTLANEAIKNSPYDFGITHGIRSPKLQNKLYQQGRTKPGKIVTYIDGYNKKSKHNYDPALAMDIAVYVSGEITWKLAFYEIVANHIMSVSERLFEENKISNRIVWGGNWKKFKDYPHFQI